MWSFSDLTSVGVDDGWAAEASFPAEFVNVHAEFVEDAPFEFGLAVFQDHGCSEVLLAVGAWQEF